MYHHGRFAGVSVRPALFVTGLVLAAMVCLNDPVFAGTSLRKGRGARPRAAEPKIDPATARARALFQTIDWEEGPQTVGLGTIAELKLKEGFLFAEGDAAKTFLESWQYSAPKDLLGVVAAAGAYHWFMVIESKPEVRKDGRHIKPDADLLLIAVRQQNTADNAARRTRGWPERSEPDWERPPAYDKLTGTVTWVTRSDASGQPLIRATTRVFGESGAIDAHVVCSAQGLPTVETTVANMLTLLAFADAPEFGERRERAKAAGAASEPTSTTTTTPTYTYTSSGGVARTFTRSPRTIGGFFTAVFGAIGAVFRKMTRKKSTPAPAD